jgi:hypothetical protein
MWKCTISRKFSVKNFDIVTKQKHTTTTTTTTTTTNNNNNNNKCRQGTGIRIDLGNPLPVVRGDYLGRMS